MYNSICYNWSFIWASHNDHDSSENGDKVDKEIYGDFEMIGMSLLVFCDGNMSVIGHESCEHGETSIKISIVGKTNKGGISWDPACQLETYDSEKRAQQRTLQKEKTICGSWVGIEGGSAANGRADEYAHGQQVRHATGHRHHKWRKS